MYLAIAAAASFAAASAAAGAAAGQELPATPAGGFHAQVSPDIIVTAPVAQQRFDAAGSTSVLQGTDLASALRPSLGDTLARTAGVSASSFGPVASRPILRGLQGERVQILTDGIGSIDASSASADHAVAINPLLAERIEIVRGPQALLYGTSAIGGLVNVLDRRIPRAVPDEPVHVQGSASYGSAADERATSLAADAAITRHFVVHADASIQKSADLRIGGNVLAKPERQAALLSAALPADEQVDSEGEPLDFAATAALRGRLPNSEGRNWTAGVGAALIGEGGNLGISYSHLANRYGVPIRYATAPGETEEAPTIDLVQNRFDARGEVDSDGPLLESINARFGYASYRHFELEEDGSIGTAFFNRGMEGRIELVQQAHGGWTGASGGQFSAEDFDVTGDEAFLPKNSTTKLALFSLQQLDLDSVKLQAALRLDRQTASALPQQGSAFSAASRSFTGLSASLGASLALADSWRLGLNLARSSRAPSAEELYADGPHGGTQAYELGNPNLAPERSLGGEIALRHSDEHHQLDLSAYYSRYSSFIYQDPAGALRDGLPIYETHQGTADYYGFELQGKSDLLKIGGATLSVDGLADYVRATIRNQGPAPQIPPLRLLAGLGLNGSLVDVRGEVEHVRTQERVAEFETPTAGYTLVNAELTLRPWADTRPLTFTLSADNLLNVNARRHASLLKDFAPLAGRDLRLSAQFSF